MAQPIDIVAQYCMDQYYKDYKGASDFFDFDDFVYYAGATIADYYRQEFAAKYAELKAEKSESMVVFGDDLLVSKSIKAVPFDNGFKAEMDFSFMSFSYDTKNAGIQSVFSGGQELERTSVSELWQVNLTPVTNRIFFWIEGKSMKFYTKGMCRVVDVLVYYVPGVSKNMLVPDGIIKYTIDTTVATMLREVIIKETNDGNPNKIMESEINKAALK